MLNTDYSNLNQARREQKVSREDRRDIPGAGHAREYKTYHADGVLLRAYPAREGFKFFIILANNEVISDKLRENAL